MSGVFDIYDCLRENVGEGYVLSHCRGKHWNMCETDTGSGIALRIAVDSIAPTLPQDITGMSVNELSGAVESWNLDEAGMALAAVNAVMNTEKNAARYNAAGGRYTDGLELKGKTLGVVGHFKSVEMLRREVKTLYVLERAPKSGDYPDSACDWLLPKCDLVFITGCSITNKTLPHLLTLCQNAYTVLTGPSVPMCRELFDFGIDRIAGTIVSDVDGMRRHVMTSDEGSPVAYGKQFILSR